MITILLCFVIIIITLAIIPNRRSNAHFTFGSKRLKSNRYYKNKNNNCSIVRRSHALVESLKSK